MFRRDVRPLGCPRRFVPAFAEECTHDSRRKEVSVVGGRTEFCALKPNLSCNLGGRLDGAGSVASAAASSMARGSAASIWREGLFLGSGVREREDLVSAEP